MKDGNDWVINGSKMWITNSYEADFFLIFANIDPSKGYKGITCFIATKDMGITIAKKEEKLGIRASSTCALSFDDLRIPAENVLGGEGKGYKIAIEILNGDAAFDGPVRRLLQVYPVLRAQALARRNGGSPNGSGDPTPITTSTEVA